MAETKTKKSKLFPNEPLVKIKIPITRTEKNDVDVTVNLKTILIKRGVEVEVPKCVVEALEHQEKQTMSIVERMDALTSKASADELN